MRLSLSSACLYLFPLRYLFRVAAESGYQGIELVMAPEVKARGVTYVRALSREFGLPVLSVHQTMVPVSVRGLGASRMADAATAALALDCPQVVIHDPCAAQWSDPAARRWTEELTRCQQILLGSGTRLALENPGWYHARDAGTTLAQPLALLSCARQFDLDLTYDTCHAGSAGMSVSQAYEILRSRVVNVHLSDLAGGQPPLGLNTLRTLLIHHQMPGEGTLALGPFLNLLAEDGYAGPVTLELSVTALRAWSPPLLRRRLVQAAEYVRSAVRSPQALEPAKLRA